MKYLWPNRFLNILYKIEHWLWPELILMWTLLLGPSLNKSDCSLCSRQNCRRIFKHRTPSAGAHLGLCIYLWGARFTLIFFLHVLFASLVGTYTLIFLQCFSKKRSRIRLHCEDIGFFRALHSLHRHCPLWSPLPSSPITEHFLCHFFKLAFLNLNQCPPLEAKRHIPTSYLRGNFLQALSFSSFSAFLAISLQFYLTLEPPLFQFSLRQRIVFNPS